MYSLAVLNDSKLASGSTDIYLWNVNNATSNFLAIPTSAVFCLASLKDNSLASGLYDNSIQIWKTN